MLMNEYVTDKLRELEAERLNRTLIANQLDLDAMKARSKGKPVIGPVLRVAGRTLRRMGAGLESWAEPQASEPEQRLGLERRSW